MAEMVPQNGILVVDSRKKTNSKIAQLFKMTVQIRKAFISVVYQPLIP